MKPIATSPEQQLLTELSQLIEQSKQQVVAQANSTLTLLFWHIGNRINQNILQNKRADYAKSIVSTVSTQLKTQYGSNFELRNLRRMMQFADQFSDYEIVVTLSRQLSWSHFVELLPLKNKEAKLFYAEKSGGANWGIRDLRKQIAANTLAQECGVCMCASFLCLAVRYLLFSFVSHEPGKGRCYILHTAPLSFPSAHL